MYAQLFPQGTLTSVKTTAQQGFANDSNIGSDIKLFKAEAKTGKSGFEGIEHVFDASWSVPLEVLEELSNRSLVHHSLKANENQWVDLGSIVIESGFLRLIDYATIKDLWDPTIRLMAGQSDASQAVGPFGSRSLAIGDLLSRATFSSSSHLRATCSSSKTSMARAKIATAAS